MEGRGFRPPPGAHQQALTQRMPGGMGPSGGMGGMGAMRTPQGSPMGPGGFMGGPGGGAPQARPYVPGGNFGSMGTMGAGWNPGLMDGPSQHMFTALPQGLEEAFGFAPQGFTASLQRGQKGPFGGGMF